MSFNHTLTCALIYHDADSQIFPSRMYGREPSLQLHPERNAGLGTRLSYCRSIILYLRALIHKSLSFLRHYRPPPDLDDMMHVVRCIMIPAA